jgi:hypothetical protein
MSCETENFDSTEIVQMDDSQFECFLMTAFSHDLHTSKESALKEALDKGIDVNKAIESLIGYRIQASKIAIYKNLLLYHPHNHVTPNNFLKLVLESSSDGEGDSYSQYSLIEEAISLGADVNLEYDNGMRLTKPLDEASELGHDINNLLKAHGAKCSKESERATDFFKETVLPFYSSQPLKFAQKISENFSAQKAEVNKIPYLMHHIWLTHPLSPREILEDQLKEVLETQEYLKKSDKPWTHIVWTNDKSLIPNSVLKLEEQGFEVRSIEPFRNELRLFTKVEELIDKKLYGLASDTLRYSIIEHFGGVYSDLNFHFYRSLDEEMYKYDFFSKDFQNSFFAAKPSHPILTTLMDKVELNFLNPPKYIATINSTDVITQTVYTTLLPFSFAYLHSANTNSNLDIVLELHESESKNFWAGDYACPDYYNMFYTIPSSEGFCFPLVYAFGNGIGTDSGDLSWL